MKHFSTRRRKLCKIDAHLTFVLLCFTLLLPLQASAQAIRLVALTGDLAPGATSGESFSSFEINTGFITQVLLDLNASGQVAFTASLSGVGVDSSNAIGNWSEGSGTLSLVVREGDSAPGTLGVVVFDKVFGPELNSAGDVNFYANLAGSGIGDTNRNGYWSGNNSTLDLAVRQGDQAADFPLGVNYRYLSGYRQNPAGQATFFARVVGNGISDANDHGIWLDSSGTFELIAREGDQAPGTSSGVSFGGLSIVSGESLGSSSLDFPLINSAGQVLFRAKLTGNGTSAINDSGYWLGNADSVELVARKGEQAPGTLSGVRFSGLSPPKLTSMGKIGFRARVVGNGVDSSNDEGIWSNRSGSLSLVVREGDQVPGAPSGVKFGIFHFYIESNDAGQIAFKSTLTGAGVDTSNDSGLWSEGSGTLKLVAREGDQAPGTPSGVFFDYLFASTLSTAGQTLLTANLRGADIDATNNRANCY